MQRTVIVSTSTSIRPSYVSDIKSPSYNPFIYSYDYVILTICNSALMLYVAAMLK